MSATHKGHTISCNEVGQESKLSGDSESGIKIKLNVWCMSASVFEPSDSSQVSWATRILTGEFCYPWMLHLMLHLMQLMSSRGWLGYPQVFAYVKFVGCSV